MGAGLVDDAPNDSQSVVSAGKPERRFLSEFRRQGAHVDGIHVRRIADNQVKGAGRRAVEQVGAGDFRTSGKTKATGVALREINGARIGIDQNSLRSRELFRCQQAEAAAAATQVQYAPGWAGKPRPKAVEQHRADGGARHDDTGFNHEPTPAVPRPAKQPG